MYIVDSKPHRQEELEHNLYGAKKAAIQDSEEEIRKIFARFSLHAGDLMKRSQVPLPRVKLTWSYYKGELSKEVNRAGDIESFLMAISGCQGPYAYRYLSDLLTLFCKEEGKKLVAEYEEELKRLLLKHKRVILPQQDRMQFRVKVDRELSQTNESDFRITLLRLFGGTTEDFLLEDIRGGCTELTYIISSKFAEHLRARIIVSVEGLKNAKILQLTLEG